MPLRPFLLCSSTAHRLSRHQTKAQRQASAPRKLSSPLSLIGCPSRPEERRFEQPEEYISYLVACYLFRSRLYHQTDLESALYAFPSLHPPYVINDTPVMVKPAGIAWFTSAIR